MSEANICASYGTYGGGSKELNVILSIIFNCHYGITLKVKWNLIFVFTREIHKNKQLVNISTSIVCMQEAETNLF